MCLDLCGDHIIIIPLIVQFKFEIGVQFCSICLKLSRNNDALKPNVKAKKTSIIKFILLGKNISLACFYAHFYWWTQNSLMLFALLNVSFPLSALSHNLNLCLFVLWGLLNLYFIADSRFSGVIGPIR